MWLFIYTAAEQRDFRVVESYLTEHLNAEGEELSRRWIELCLLRDVRRDGVEQRWAHVDGHIVHCTVWRILTQVD